MTPHNLPPVVGVPLKKRTRRMMVEDFMEYQEVMRARLAKWGPEIMKRLMREQSLREIARSIDKSPTYLSLVLNGKQVVSVETYRLLASLAGDV